MSGLICINDDYVRAIPDKRASIAACVKLSGLPLKAISSTLHIEHSHLIKMISGTGDSLRHFPQDKELPLMDLCRNEIPLIWTMIKRGYPSVRCIAAMESELAALRAEVAQLRADSHAITNVFKFIGD